MTVADSAGRGVAAVRVTLDGGAAAVLTDSAGRATFPSVAAGAHPIALGLPLGYDTLPGQPRTLTVSGATASVAIRVRAVSMVTRTLRTGVPDTLALANGMAVVALAATNAVPALTVRAVPPSAAPAGGEFDGGVEIVLGAGGAPGLSPVRLAGPAQRLRAADEVALTVLAPMPAGASGAVFGANVGTPAQPIYLYATATSTTVVLPNGQSRTYALRRLTVPPTPMSQFVGVAPNDDACVGADANARYLLAVDGEPDRLQAGDTRRVIILVHGWQMGKTSCAEVKEWEPARETWKDFLERFTPDEPLTERYRVFAYRYPTFEPIQRNADWLDATLAARGLDQQAVVVAHSMGGLVARGMFARRLDEKRADPIGALITLGTPHEGSPLAELLNDEDPNGGWALLRKTAGARDLRPTSPFITAMRGRRADGLRVFAFGGLIGDGATWQSTGTNAVLKGMGVTVSDGVVPIESAVPSWTTLQTRLADRDHLQLTEGAEVFARVREVLLGLADDCRTPPAVQQTNDFLFSGNVARRPGTRIIEAAINPITINGTPVVAVADSNFTVVENGCAKRVAVSSGGGVPVDLVFVQDLSTSMTGAIAGARSSVVAFAQSLAAQGLDVRFGSVGFTGGGTIPTTPAGSRAEFLGPVQDFTTVGPFQTFVGTWRVGGDIEGNRDFEENPLEAIEYAHQRLSWRPGAARVYVLVTDARMHVAGDVCNGQGACTDQTVASILTMLGTSAVVHVVVPTSPSGVGASPQALATGTGGVVVPMPGNGVVDLTRTGLAATLGRTVKLTYTSMTGAPAMERLRVISTFWVSGRKFQADLSPGLVQYSRFATDGPAVRGCPLPVVPDRVAGPTARPHHHEWRRTKGLGGPGDPSPVGRTVRCGSGEGPWSSPRSRSGQSASFAGGSGPE